MRAFENIYEEGVVDYNYRACRIFPENTRVIEADLDVPYTTYSNRILHFRVPKGTYVDDYERIVFF